jgi:hypothetical protein
MYDVRPFAPLYIPNTGLLSSVTVNAITNTATSGTLPGNLGNNGFCQIQISNTSYSSWAYINFGRTVNDITAATVAGGYPVASGSVVVVTVSSEVSAVSVIMGTGSGSVIFTRGSGS